MGPWGWGLALALQLPPADVVRIQELLDAAPHGRDLEADEREYQGLVQRQIFADLALVYRPENQRYVRIAYARFVPEGGKPGRDLGYGLHVVKRLELPGGKIVDVNEQWAEDRTDGGLFLPDEIRVKTLVFPGPRHVPGSHRKYLFDSIRLAWEKDDSIRFHRQSRFDGSRRKLMRVAVSPHLSCQGCHRPGRGFDVLSDEFRTTGVPVSHDAIVQDDYFARPLPEMLGYRDYVAHSESRGDELVQRVKAALDAPAKTFAVPGIVEALARQGGEISWLPEDGSLSEQEAEVLWPRPGDRQGYYFRRGRWGRDALEDTIEGKYQGWTPRSVVPGPR